MDEWKVKIQRLAAALNPIQRMTDLADKHRSTTALERNGLRPQLAELGRWLPDQISASTA